MSRGMLEQEMYEALIEQGVDEMTADIVASEQAVDVDDVIPWKWS